VISERHIVRELVFHGLAFCIAAGVAAIFLYRNYGFLEAHTEDASTARDAFLTCIIVAGGIGPAIMLLAFWVLGRTRISRDRAQ
jgi:hypothetical protein